MKILNTNVAILHRKRGQPTPYDDHMINENPKNSGIFFAKMIDLAIFSKLDNFDMKLLNRNVANLHR